MMEVLKQIVAPFGAMVVGYTAVLFAYSQGWSIPADAEIPIWLMAPVLAGVLSVWNRNKGGT